MNNNMNKKMRMLIICAVFAMISSCKNYANSEDLKNLEQQNVKGKVKGFLDTKERIVSDDPTVYEIAEKLKEEEELKDKKENKQEKVEREEKQEAKEELIQSDDPNSHSNMQVVKTTRDSGGQQKEEQRKEEDKKEKEEREREEDLKRRRRERYKEDQKKMEERKKQLEKRRKEREEEAKENPLKKITKNKIKEAANKIDTIISNIDNIEREQDTTGKRVEDNVTYPIYDDITDAKDSIYIMWGENIDDSNIDDLFTNLRNIRYDLRGKIKDNNDTNKNIVKVSDIRNDLKNLKSYLEKIKVYLENSENEELILKAIKCAIFNEDCYYLKVNNQYF